MVVSNAEIHLADENWTHVDELISQYAFLPDVSFTAGTAAGRLHTFQKGALNMKTPVILASSSKFPAALAIAGAVADGHLSFDTRAYELLEWWSSAADDLRSGVTLRHLLTFTSGLVSTDFGGAGIACLDISPLSNASKLSAESCARDIYEQGPWMVQPGTQWSYHSLHLQIAGVMAAKAAGLSVQQLLRKYLLDRLNMTSSHWIGNRRGVDDPNPHLAAAFMSTGDDYDKLLRAVLSYSIATKEIIDEMEIDAYRAFPKLATANDPKDKGLLIYGHYSMCTYFECVNQPWSNACEKRGIHADPGALGYWPLIHRSKGYYMQLVVSKQVKLPPDVMKKYNVSKALVAALSAQCVAPLRFSLAVSVETALGLNASAPVPMPPQRYPVKQLCKLASGPGSNSPDGFASFEM